MSDNKASDDWSQPKSASDLDYAFPAVVIGRFIPCWDDLPAPFRNRSSGFEELATHVAFNAVSFRDGVLRDGIDAHMANRQISIVARSFEPKHEHKEAGLAYLLSLWLRQE